MKALLLFFSLLLISCSKNDDSADVSNKSQVLFTIEKQNSSSNYLSNVHSFELKSKSSHWRKTAQGEMARITKEVLYNVTLENGEVVEFGLWFSKMDVNKDLLILDTNDPSVYEGSSWDYFSSSVEFQDFYQNCDIRIMLNDNVIFTNPKSDSLNIINIETIWVDSDEKSLLHIEFEGSAREFFDPNGIHQPYYDLTNGFYKGIVE